MSETTDNVPTPQPSVYDLVMYMVDQWAAISWQKLGLQPDAMTGKVEKNLPEAKVAIDLTAHLAGILEAQLDDGDKRRIHGLVRDLRINYVQKNTEAE